MKFILNAGRKGVFCLCANGTLCSRVDEPMARGKISLPLALPNFFLLLDQHLYIVKNMCIYTHI